MQQISPYAGPTPYAGRTNVPTYAIVSLIVAGIGTGGHYTREYHEQHDAGRTFFKSANDSSLGAAVATTADELAYIKATLKLTVKELADCVGVSRQAIYNWKSGVQIKSQNTLKLAQLKAAASILQAEKVPVSPLVMERKLSGGKTLLETISDGGDGEAAAKSLVNMLRDEAEQQRMVNERFADRPYTASSTFDYGVPSFSERG
jgi:DNA-binding XRE family transcriptional regulator